MKHTLALLLAAAMVLSLAGCGAESAPAATQPAPEVTEGVAPFDTLAAEAEIRYALSLLLNRNFIVEELTEGGKIPAASFVAPGITDADGTEFYENAGYYDLREEAYVDNFAEAYRILSQYYQRDVNGMFTDFPVLTYVYPDSETHREIAEYLKATLASVGIRLNTQPQKEEKDFQLAGSFTQVEEDDPLAFLKLWTSDSAQNPAEFGRGQHADAAGYELNLNDLGMDIHVVDGTWAQTYDYLLELIESTTDSDSRYALMHKAEDLLMGTGAIVPLYFDSYVWMLDDTVKGFYTSPAGTSHFRKTTYDGSEESLSFCLSADAFVVDPALCETAADATLLSHLFAGLARWERDSDGRPVLAHDCAESLPEGVQNEDGTVTYTYTLKEDLKWSDDKPLTAEDFVFAWNRAASLATEENRHLFAFLQGAEGEGELSVKALDKRTLEVTLCASVAGWNEMLAMPVFFPVREDVVSEADWMTDPAAFVSNGAYTMTEREENSAMTLTANEHYHDASSVTMTELKANISDDTDHMLTNFRNGTWQMIDAVPADEIENLKTDYPDACMVTGQRAVTYICWNVNAPLLP